MTDTKELLARIAALKTRLNSTAMPPVDSLRGLEEKVARGGKQNALIERTLTPADPEVASAEPASFRLTARGVRLLRQAREHLQGLRQIADEPLFATDSSDRNDEVAGSDAMHEWHREGMAMIEVVLRTVQAMPASVSAQLRMCEGLEFVLTEVQERIGRVQRRLAERKNDAARIDELAGYLRALAKKQSMSLTPLQAAADRLLHEARIGLPLQFLYASPIDPSRFAAAHGLTVGQVLARLVMEDAEVKDQAQQAVMAALVHDVGMTRVPAEVLTTEGPLDNDQRRLVEKHTTVAADMLTALWPGGGWVIEAATCHHERSDGTGYPLGQREIQLAPMVQLLAVCDVYAALCCPRPHRPAFDTRNALTEVLLLAERGQLHAASAERLLCLSFYPVGSIVELADGAIARVLSTHGGEVGMTHPDRPVVQLLCESDGHAVSWPVILDLMEHMDCSILRGLRADERCAALAKSHPHLM